MSRTRARLRRQSGALPGGHVRPLRRRGAAAVTNGPFAETKDLIAGWMVIDVETYERALELAGELSAAPGAGGKPIHEWLEVRPLLAASPTITE
ncbi:YciI family protein [Nocardia sp. NBC_00403]